MEPMDPPPYLHLPEVEKVVAFLMNPEGLAETNLERYLPHAGVTVAAPFPPEDESIHVAFHLAGALQEAGIPLNPAMCLKEACERPLLDIRHQLMDERPSDIVIHPGSGSPKKNYPPDLWLEIISSLKAQVPQDPKTEILLLLGPAEEGLRQILDHTPAIGPIQTLHYPDEEQLVATLKHASLYIGHDSGITHLAAMLGTPTVALFKRSSIEQWRPLGPSVRVIEEEKKHSVLVSKAVQQAKTYLSNNP
jgi:ADP-heptose:LPS heptosyltransferase